MNEFAEQDADRAPRFYTLVNNAGTSEDTSFGHYTEMQFDRILQLNLRAPFLLLQCLTGLLELNTTLDTPAQIINVSSIASMLAPAMDAFTYNPSKAALKTMARIDSKRLASD